MISPLKTIPSVSTRLSGLFNVLLLCRTEHNSLSTDGNHGAESSAFSAPPRSAEDSPQRHGELWPSVIRQA
jgi:hypothetical protein